MDYVLVVTWVNDGRGVDLQIGEVIENTGRRPIGMHVLGPLGPFWRVFFLMEQWMEPDMLRLCERIDRRTQDAGERRSDSHAFPVACVRELLDRDCRVAELTMYRSWLQRFVDHCKNAAVIHVEASEGLPVTATLSLPEQEVDVIAIVAGIEFEWCLRTLGAGIVAASAPIDWLRVEKAHA